MPDASVHRTMISAGDLLARYRAGAGDLVILDCGFDLADTAAGERAHAQAHLPGALYVHLDRDLSGAKTGQNGRHPLPAREAFAARVGAWGIGPTTEVVAYDAQGGPYAARAWWMLRWLGHDAAAVLDGGLAAWQAAGGELESAPVRPAAAGGPPYPLHPLQKPLPMPMPIVQAAELQSALAAGRVQLIDARGGERFRGEVEPLDPVAGHIPGAINRFFKDNLGPDGRFKAPSTLRDEFTALGVVGGGAGVVHQCGSGVTACHNLLAMAHAGWAGTALYPGSWSEWCADPTRPVARG
jgi:thiosulfate/3-mercaptopyruvate sulfurtransferase